jgi:hypothetical protein
MEGKAGYLSHRHEHHGQRMADSGLRPWPGSNDACYSAAAFALRSLRPFGLCGIARRRYYAICVVPWRVWKCFTEC